MRANASVAGVPEAAILPAMTTTIFIDGEAGTTGLQIRERLAGRDDLSLLEIDPHRRKDVDERRRLLNGADVAILCLPDDAARESAALIESDAVRVIDASSAHRTQDGWTYGFPELGPAQTEAIRGARRIANPGCWPQGAIAGLRPLVDAGLIPPELPASVHGISGYSGGGRRMIADYERAGDAASGYSPYALGLAHKHMPELQRHSGLTARPLFTPAVGDFAQGMTVVTTLQLAGLSEVPTAARLHEALADHYAALPGGVVEVAPLGEAAVPDPASFAGSDRMRLHVFGNDEFGQAVTVAVYDNLGKGASGAAVQNLDLMVGR